MRTLPDVAWMCLLISLTALATAPAAAADRFEPNDSVEAAKELKPDAEVSITFDKKGDVDYFKIRAPADGVLTRRVLKNPAGHALFHWWRDGGGKPFRHREDDIRVRRNELVHFAIRGDENPANSRASNEVVRLKIAFTAEPAPGEPNDFPGSAQPVTIGKPFQLAFFPRLDVDILQATAPDDGALQLQLLEKPDIHVWPYVWWLDDAGKPVRGGEWDRRVKRGEKVLIALRSNYYPSDSKSSPETLKLKVKFIREPFAGEVNDTLEAAQPVDLGKPLKIAFLPRLDQDVLRLKAPGNGTLAAKLLSTPDAHPAPHVWWIDEKGAERRFREWDTRVKEGDTIYFAARSNLHASDSRSSPDPLALRFDFIPEPFPGEPNDTPETAQPITLGQPFDIAFTPRLDQDVFKVVGPENGTVSVRILAKPDIHVAPRFWWMNADGKVFRDGESDARVKRGETIYLGARSNYYPSDSRSSPEPLKLQVDFVREPFAGESNDTIATAQTVTLAKPFNIAFTPRLDRDVFKLVGPDNGTLSVRVLEKPDIHVAPWFWWMDAEGRTLRDGERDARVRRGETLYLAARANLHDSDSRSSPEPLKLQIDFIREPFPGEPNDSTATAQPISVGQPFNIAYTPRLDRDVFKLIGPDDGTIGVEILERPDVHVAPWFWWIDASGRVLREGEQDARVRRGQTIYLATRANLHDSDSRSSPEPLKLNIKFIREPFAGEPNDQLETAQAPPIGKPFPIAFTPRLDVDMFRLPARQDGTFKVTVLKRPAAHPAPYFWWYSADGKIIREGELDASVKRGEIVYLAARSNLHASDSVSSPEPLDVRIDFFPLGDANEPNDSIAQATKLAPGGRAALTFEPRGDRDIYRIDLPRDALLRASFQELPDDLHPVFSWLDGRGKVVQANRPDYWAPADSTVYLSVRSAYHASDERVVRDELTLRLAAIFTTDVFEPNDRPDQAAPITLRRRIRGELIPGESDHFRFQLRQPGVYLAEIAPRDVAAIQWLATNGGLLANGRELTVENQMTVIAKLTPAASVRDQQAPYDFRVVRIGDSGDGQPGLYPRRPPSLSLSAGVRNLPIIQRSTFDRDAEGWTTAGDARRLAFQPPGHLTARDQQSGDTWWWKAPDRFCKGLASAYGGQLEFQLQQSEDTNQYEDADIVMVTPKATLVYDFPTPPQKNVWTDFRASLVESAWKNRATNAPLGKVEFQSALRSVTELRIRGEFSGHGDTGAIDNVFLLKPPR